MVDNGLRYGFRLSTDGRSQLFLKNNGRNDACPTGSVRSRNMPSR
jgi:hypothetical protein